MTEEELKDTLLRTEEAMAEGDRTFRHSLIIMAIVTVVVFLFLYWIVGLSS